jgi:hypothetical protein
MSVRRPRGRRRVGAPSFKECGETPSRKPVTTEGGRIRPPMRLRGEANVGGVPPEPTGGSGTCRTGPEHVAPITGYGAKAPVGFPCWMSRSTPACHIGKERPIRGACRRASPQPIRRSGAALDYPTAHPHAPRSLTWRDELQHPGRRAPVRWRERIWKRTTRCPRSRRRPGSSLLEQEPARSAQLDPRLRGGHGGEPWESAHKPNTPTPQPAQQSSPPARHMSRPPALHKQRQRHIPPDAPHRPS